jgi:hypothetical protein
MRGLGTACAVWIAGATVLAACAGGGRARRVASVRGAAAPAERIAEAIRAARPGDTVLIDPGLYEGSVWVESAGAPGAPIVVRSASGLGTVQLQGGGETLNIGAGAHDLVFEGLELRGSRDNLVHVQGGAHDVVLRDLIVHDAGDDGDGIKVNQARRVLIERVECYRPGRRPDRPDGNPAQECIDLLDVEQVVVQDCYLHDGGNMLVYAKGGSRDVVIQRNIVVGQGPEAIDPCVGLGAWTDRDLLGGREYEAEDVVFRNNLVAHCRAGAVGVYDARRALVLHNSLVDDGPEVIQFRAGNAPRAESRAVWIANNVLVDTGGAMQRPIVRRSHEVADLAVFRNLYWNSGRPVFAGLTDPAEEPGAVLTDPGLRLPAMPAATRARWREGLEPLLAARDRAASLQGAGAVRDDLFRGRRPAGAGPDLGAVEFGAEPSLPGESEPCGWPGRCAALGAPRQAAVAASHGAPLRRLSAPVPWIPAALASAAAAATIAVAVQRRRRSRGA